MRKVSINRFLIVALLSCLPWQMAVAQELRLSVDECIRRAKEQNLEVVVARAEAEKARDLQSTAYEMDLTELSLSQDPTAGGSPDNAITLSQSFDFPTVYAARRKYLRSQTAAQSAVARLSELSVERDVASAYYNLVYLRSVYDILQRQDSVYARFFNIASARKKAGDTSSLEQMNAQRALDDSRIRLQRADADCQIAMAELQQLLATDTVIVPIDSHLAPISDILDTENFRFEQTSVAESYEAQAEMSRRNLQLQRQMFLPRINIGLRSQCVIKGFNPYDVQRDAFDKGNFMGFEVGVSVPLFWGSTRAKARAARREVEIQQLRQQNAQAIVARDYQKATAEMNQARLSLDYYQQQAASQATEMARLSQISYEAGEIAYVEYIQNQAAALDLNLKTAEAINNYNQAVIRLKYLTR